MFNSNTQIAVYRIPSTLKTDLDVQFEDQQRLLIKMFTLHNRLKTKFEPYIFLFFIGSEFGV